MNYLLKILFQFLSTHVVTIVTSVGASIISSQIILIINRKRDKRNKLRDICREYIKEAQKLHDEFAGRIFNNDGTNCANVINEYAAHSFNRRIMDDNELHRLMKYFSIESDDINAVLRKHDEEVDSTEWHFYNVVDELKEEFSIIEEQI